jgi:hypothetical protein
MRLGISALRNRGRELPSGLHFALEEWCGQEAGWERRASFIVPRGSQLEKFFTALQRAEAEAIGSGWWPQQVS